MELRAGAVDVGDDGEAVEDLFRWLAGDSELAYRSRMSLRPAPLVPGEQGGAFEAVNIVLANVTALGSLVTAVLTYRDARRRTHRPGAQGSLRLERDGVVVTITPESQVSAERIIALLSDPSDPIGDDEQPQRRP
ncbi:hypothetical protein PV416_32775 [Streptomyces ipomoeae]|jgi:hypothetical protein|uniref:effector-associated constant component EACC1 n=1 Tax=Streptomyces ipomoeae TaxID=103232 RepID=UPI0029B84C5F|nr:hypothetical protein [Streptomyces ipomoeae]MDX2825719.1 hypothetical protein [Streptomyces ipomoeae]MDX2875653.1 hypothetical protein [Streptomyces ipomoeae]